MLVLKSPCRRHAKFIVGIIRTFILVLVFRYLWLALYAGREVFAGVTIEQTITYVTISMVITPLFPNFLILAVNSRIRKGDILFDIARPMNYRNLLFLQTTGRSLARFLTSSLPLFIFICFTMKITLPTSIFVWLAFLASLILSFFIAFFIDFIASLSGFWITEMGGIRFLKWSMTDILSGVYIPLWIFPSFLKKVVLFLPFRGIHYTPLSILVGKIDIHHVPMEFGFQLMWIGVLFFLSSLFYVLAVKKLAVQGG